MSNSTKVFTNMPAVSETMQKPARPGSGEELLDAAIETVYTKLKHVNHTSHIVALSQELRELLKMRSETGYEDRR
jgi:hypothetical protein